jgi:ABC-2 type transport system permease protein
MLQVARREYLAYISAWGFWLGLLVTPLSVVVGAMLPQWIERSQPDRVYVVVDSSREFADAVNRVIEDRRADETRAMLSGALAGATAEQRSVALKSYSAALLAGADAEGALAAIGAPPGVEAPRRRLFEIEAPARTAEDLAPYLAGDSLAAAPDGAANGGPDGGKELFAALLVSRGADGKIAEVVYLSRDVLAGELPSAARAALRDLARCDLLGSAGLAPDTLDRMELQLPTVVERKAGAEAQAEVSLADRTPFLAAAALAFLLWALVFSIVNFLIMGTIEERSNKIFDLLLTSVRLSDLLAGKLLGVFLLCATLMAGWATVGGVLLLRSGNTEILSFALSALQPELVVAAGLGFVGGYLMYAAIFLALGSLCETIQEAQTLISPLFILLTIPLFLVVIALQSPDSRIIEYLAWFPPFTPFLMVLRAPLEPPLWETLGQAGVMTAFAALCLFVSVRIYRAGAVDGAGVSAAWSWLRPRSKA